MRGLNYFLVFFLGAGLGLAVAFGFSMVNAGDGSGSSASEETSRPPRSAILCEGGTLDQFRGAVESYTGNDEEDRDSELGVRLITLRFDRLLFEAYVAANYPTAKFADKLRINAHFNQITPTMFDASKLELERNELFETLISNWDSFGEMLNADMLGYLGSVDPSATFDANWSAPNATRRLGTAEIVARQWLASSPRLAFRHLSAVKDLPTPIRLMLVESISEVDTGTAMEFIDDSPEFSRGMLVETLIDSVGQTANEEQLSNIFKHYFRDDGEGFRISGQYYRSGLERLVDAAHVRAPTLVNVFIDGITSPDVRDSVSMRVRR